MAWFTPEQVRIAMNPAQVALVEALLETILETLMRHGYQGPFEV